MSARASGQSGEVFRVTMHGVEQAFSAEQLRMKLTELGGLAKRATEAALKAQVEFGVLVLQVREPLRGRFGVWLAGMSPPIHRAFAHRCAAKAAAFADAHGHFDRQKVLDAITSYNSAQAASGGFVIAVEVTPSAAEIVLGMRKGEPRNVSDRKHSRDNPQETATREYDDIDEVLGFAPSRTAGLESSGGGGRSTQITSTLGVSARAPGGGLVSPHARSTATRHAEEAGSETADAGRMQSGGWAGPARDDAKAAPRGMSDSRRHGLSGGSGNSAPAPTSSNRSAQLHLEGEYRAAAMARELAGLIESGQAAPGIVAEFVAWAQRVGLGLDLKGGA